MLGSFNHNRGETAQILRLGPLYCNFFNFQHFLKKKKKKAILTWQFLKIIPPR